MTACAYVPRLMVSGDIPDVVLIDRLCEPEEPLSETSLKELLRSDRNLTAIVIYDPFRGVLGFAIYKFYSRSLSVERLAVHPQWRRFGFGAALARKMMGRLDSKARRRWLVAWIPERYLPGGARFWQALGAGEASLHTPHDSEPLVRMVYRPPAAEGTALSSSTGQVDS